MAKSNNCRKEDEVIPVGKKLKTTARFVGPNTATRKADVENVRHHFVVRS